MTTGTGEDTGHRAEVLFVSFWQDPPSGQPSGKNVDPDLLPHGHQLLFSSIHCSRFSPRCTVADPGAPGSSCPQDFLKIMQFSGNSKKKNPILSKFWAQGPPPPKNSAGPLLTKILDRHLVQQIFATIPQGQNKDLYRGRSLL